MLAELCDPSNMSRFSIHRLQQSFELNNLQEELEGIGRQAQQVSAVCKSCSRVCVCMCVLVRVCCDTSVCVCGLCTVLY